MTAPLIDWPKDFAPDIRKLIEARDTPPGGGRPRCTICGERVTGTVIHIHHLLYVGRGGLGRPDNGTVVHGEEQADGCHVTRIHREARHGYQCEACGWKTAKWRGRCGQCQAWGTVEGDSPTAAALGWARSRHAPRPAVYHTPLLCAWRGWIVLELDGGWHPATDGEMRGAR
jgi:Rubredoxin metal binding domain